MVSIQELKEAYKGEWLAIAVVHAEGYEPQEGELIYHSKDREDVWRRIKHDRRRIYITYAGAFLEEGYAAAF